MERSGIHGRTGTVVAFSNFQLIDFVSLAITFELSKTQYNNLFNRNHDPPKEEPREAVCPINMAMRLASSLY